MPKVSIIIPCYNVESYIDKCLTSVENQNFNDYEIILIDDGSIDGTLKKCVEWKKKDERIIVISKKNEGQGIARNIGIKIAKGEYITFLDADDWWNKNYLSEMISGTENYKNDIVICNSNFVYETEKGFSKKISIIRLPEGNIDIKNEKHILSRARTQIWGKLYKKNLFNDNNFKEPNYKYEDVAITPYIIAKAKSIYHVNKPLYFYLKNRSESTINHLPLLDDLLLALSDLAENFQNDNIFEEYQTELQRIFWGELCFLYRMLETKFSYCDEEIKKYLRSEMNQIVFNTFPKLEFIIKQKFYVSPNEFLKKAAENIFPIKTQVLTQERDIYKADFAIILKNEVLPIDFNKKVILIENFDTQNIDEETIIWNLADEIYDKLIEKM